MAAKMCIRCNHALAEEAKFCGECAVSQDTSILCKNCSRSIPWDAKFCFYCGQKTEQVEKTSNKTETDVITSVGKPASVAVLEMPVSKAASEKKNSCRIASGTILWRLWSSQILCWQNRFRRRYGGTDNSFLSRD